MVMLLNCLFVYLAMPANRPLHIRKHIVFVSFNVNPV